jgi:basic membrane protein A and related proteins
MPNFELAWLVTLWGFSNVREGNLKASRVAAVVLVAILATAVAVGAGFVGTGKAAPTTAKASTTVALISDIGRFNDKSFNQAQLQGLNRAKAKLGINTIALESKSVSDYIPNLTTAVRRGSGLVIAAGFLLAKAEGQVAKQFPKTHFAITDDSYLDPSLGGAKNVEGLTYATNESSCLVGYLAGALVKKQGGKQVIGIVLGIKIPTVDIFLAGYKYCAKLANPAIKVVSGYSNSFTEADKCRAVAENQISQGAQVLFQVAGGCGLGTLKAADDAHIWGVGVDLDQYNDAKRVLTSAVKHVDVGVYDVAQQEKQGKFRAGTDLLFNLKNNGVGLGRMNPVAKPFLAQLNALKAKIIAGKLKPPVKP